ncbi:hypothetical protein ACF0H5_007018 [Mactra antiquata]
MRISDGTIILHVSDHSDRRLKRLDDQYKVKDSYECKDGPLHAVPLSSSEVAVFMKGYFTVYIHK